MFRIKLSLVKAKKTFFYFFLISIFLFKIPNLYFLPFSRNAYFTTQAVARIIIIFVFIFNIIANYLKKEKIFSLKKNDLKIINLITIFFVLESLSLLVTINTNSFLGTYKDIIIGFVFFFTSYFYRDNIKEIIIVFILGFLFNILYQFVLVFNSDFFVKSFGLIVYQKHLDFVLANLSRGRIYIDSYDELVIPFLFLPLFKKNEFKNILLRIILIINISFSLISNFRTRILMALFAFFLSVIFLMKKSLANKISYLLLILFIGSIISTFLFLSNKNSFFDRLNTNNPENISSISSRIFQIESSLEMARISVFGVGLGNYYDYISSSLKNNNSSVVNKNQNLIKLGANEYVHNIFGYIVSGSGFLSLLIFTLILYFFIKNDIQLLSKKDNYIKAIIISFWTLFIYGFFNPIVPASYQVFFWGLRGLLIN